MEMQSKYYLKFILAFVFLCLSTTNTFAAKLYFTPTTANLAVGNTGTATIYVNTEGKKVFGSDMFITITGDAVNFTKISAAGNIDSDEVDSTIEDDQLVIRVSSFDVDIEGTQALVTVTYQAVVNGTTTLSFKTGGNFDTSLVAESDTANDILTSTQGITFTVGGGINVTETCGNGTVEGSEQCEPITNTCPTGYTCSANCLCAYNGINVTITPIITDNPSNTITPIITNSNNNGNQNGNTTVPTLPTTALDSKSLNLIIISGGTVTIGLALIALFSLPEFNLELIGTKLKIKFAASSKKKFESQREKFEKEIAN
jgi:hypothetical protein